MVKSLNKSNIKQIILNIYIKCLNRNVQFQGFLFLKTKEFTSVIDYFQKWNNEEIGLFRQAPNHHMHHHFQYRRYRA